MASCVSSGTFNPTHSLTRWLTLVSAVHGECRGYVWNKIISKLGPFQRLIAAREYFPTRSMSLKWFWNYFSVLFRVWPRATLTSIHPSLLHFPHPSPLHSFTLNSKLTFLVNLFRHRSHTIDISDWLPRLMGPFSVFTVFVGVISCFWCGRQN